VSVGKSMELRRSSRENWHSRAASAIRVLHVWHRAAATKGNVWSDLDLISYVMCGVRISGLVET
jgi:hypothetical protein